jgi:hypothetical protein
MISAKRIIKVDFINPSIVPSCCQDAGLCLKGHYINVFLVYHRIKSINSQEKEGFCSLRVSNS